MIMKMNKFLIHYTKGVAHVIWNVCSSVHNGCVLEIYLAEIAFSCATPLAGTLSEFAQLVFQIAISLAHGSTDFIIEI
jgi:hypothetical protein